MKARYLCYRYQYCLTFNLYYLTSIERQKWDEDLLKWRSVEKLEENLDIYQYVCHSMAPQPSREYLILRLGQLLVLYAYSMGLHVIA